MDEVRKEAREKGQLGIPVMKDFFFLNGKEYLSPFLQLIFNMKLSKRF